MASTRIVLRPIGSGLPLGFFAFGTGMLLVGGAEIGWVPRSDASLIAVILLTFVAPLEFTAGVLAFLARDTLGGTGLALFAGSWATLGVTTLRLPPDEPSAALGLFLVAFTVAVVALGAIARTGKPLLAAILALAALRSVTSATFHLTGSEAAATTAAVLAIVIAVAAAYGGLALLLEAARGRTVLPVFRRGASAVSQRGSLEEQLEGVEHEAGVRRQL